MEQQLTREQKNGIASNPNTEDFIKLLVECQTPRGPLIADTEFQTLVNFMTMEIEARLIGNLRKYLFDIRNGNYHD